MNWRSSKLTPTILLQPDLSFPVAPSVRPTVHYHTTQYHFFLGTRRVIIIIYYSNLPYQGIFQEIGFDAPM